MGNDINAVKMKAVVNVVIFKLLSVAANNTVIAYHNTKHSNLFIDTLSS